MSWKSFTLNFIWGIVSIISIIIFSTQDKEWFIDGRGINDICDVMKYIENDDIRTVGIALTLPLFIPFIYATVWRRQRSIWQYSVIAALLFFWLWRFVIRYQLCW
ncbi:TPA: YjeO family protein [Citrobacter youngae]|uniref:YjeO family protein n=1 Tax=Citrobacter TaxID=544 RepID=UPI0005A5FB39|nr:MULTISPECIES: YjeO family protein [Citrobacter]GAS74104.1 inner membrane protein YjeO [Salmonella enterica]EIS7446149.1 YjeO family protein [Citrobacter youngae]MBJ9159786.1 YjeO family protein [Citrobacter sp. FDAARGOS_156]MBJ9557612.1 YjeO family protein [Citrobacter sp. FDAARGOS_156]TKU19227.1 DUF2645 family protein [Citrobacter sp. wls827]